MEAFSHVQDGLNALMSASANGHINVIKVLLEGNATVDAVSANTVRIARHVGHSETLGDLWLQPLRVARRSRLGL